MRFASDQGQSFSLTFAGFEPPGRKWLVIVGDVDDGTRPPDPNLGRPLTQGDLPAGVDRTSSAPQ